MKTKSCTYRRATYGDKICTSCGAIVSGAHVQSGGRTYHLECLKSHLEEDIQASRTEIERLQEFAEDANYKLD